MKWFAAILILAVIFIAGCTQQQIQNFNNSVQQSKNEQSIQNYLNNAKIKPNYTVNLVQSASSSGGSGYWNITYVIQNEEFISCSGNYHYSGDSGEKIEECKLESLNKNEYPFLVHTDVITMSDVLALIKNYDLSKSILLELQDRDCFYNIHSEFYRNILVCFNNESYIVNYAGGGLGTYQGDEIRWNMEDYYFTSQILNLIK